MKYTPLLLLLFSLAVLSCKKDRLTKETQKGANTFSCLIDGAIYKPCSHPIIGGPNDPPFYGGLNISNGIASASIGASCSDRASRHISLEIGNLTGPGEYLLSDFSNRAVYIIYGDNDVLSYSSYKTGAGKIIITKDDRANTILSGTFEFEGVDNDEPGKIIKVTSGRFDLNYKK